MSTPGINSSTSPAIQPESIDTAAPMAPVGKDGTASPPRNEVVEYPQGGVPEHASEAHHGAMSAVDFAQLMAQPKGQEKLAVMNLGESLRRMAEHGIEPRDGGFSEKEAARFESAIGDEHLQKALGKLSRDQVEGLLLGQVMKAWPEAKPEEVEAMAKHLLQRLTDASRDHLAFASQQVASEMMKKGAARFAELAANPKQLEQLSTALNQLAESDPKQARLQRSLYGLEDGPVTPRSLGEALQARSKLMEHEAREMLEHAPGTLFRALKEQKLDGAVASKLGLEPGSLASSALALVKDKGVSDQETIERARFVAALAAAFATGGLGAGGLAGVATGVGGKVVMEAPELLHTWKEVDTARASESAGTMDAGAGEAAKRKAQVKTGVAIGAAVLAGGAELGTHHAVEKLAEKGSEVLVKGTAAVLIDQGAGKVAEGVGELVEH